MKTRSSASSSKLNERGTISTTCVSMHRTRAHGSADAIFDKRWPRRERFFVPIWLRVGCDLVTIWLRKNQFGYVLVTEFMFLLRFGYGPTGPGNNLVTRNMVTIWLRSSWKVWKVLQKHLFDNILVTLALCK
jgi:hypothetical protein